MTLLFDFIRVHKANINLVHKEANRLLLETHLVEVNAGISGICIIKCLIYILLPELHSSHT